MSRAIPRRTIDTLRRYVDIAIENWGISCELYIPSNKDDVEALDVYVRPTDYEYKKYTCNVFIEWRPSTYRLKNLGIYVEDELPILIRLPNYAYNTTGSSVSVDIVKDSFIRVPVEYVPSNMQKQTDFTLVDHVIAKLHDASLVNAWKAVPRRTVNRELRETV
jgi:hypothetical protein